VELEEELKVKDEMLLKVTQQKMGDQKEGETKYTDFL